MLLKEAMVSLMKRKGFFDHIREKLHLRGRLPMFANSVQEKSRFRQEDQTFKNVKLGKICWL
jgi:hypothetical protein